MSLPGSLMVLSWRQPAPPLALRWRRPAPPLALRWRGPEAALMRAVSAAELAAAPQPAPLGTIAAIIGPPGPRGVPGQEGPPAPETDPGNLIIWLENGLA